MAPLLSRHTSLDIPEAALRVIELILAPIKVPALEPAKPMRDKRNETFFARARMLAISNRGTSLRTFSGRCTWGITTALPPHCSTKAMLTDILYLLRGDGRRVVADHCAACRIVGPRGQYFWIVVDGGTGLWKSLEGPGQYSRACT